MQKKVLAAVIGGLLAAPAAFADSANVVISGRIAAGIESYKLSGGTRTYSNEQRVSDQSSSIIFSGSEDLGGGLKAWFQIDERPSLDLGGSTAVGFAQGNTQAGFAGGWGKLAVGRQDLHYNEVGRLDAARTGSLQSIISYGPFSQVNGTVIANGTRTPNVVYWDSADLSGVTIRVGYSTNFQTNETAGAVTPPATVRNGGATTAAVRYAAGPILAGGSFWSANVEGSGSPPSDAGDQRSQRAWFGWNQAGLKAGLAYDTSKVRPLAAGSFAKRNAWLVPVSFSFGAESVYFTYAQIGKTNSTADTDAKAAMIGWDHALSKRTFVGAFYSKVDNKPAAAYNLFSNAANGSTPAAAGEDPMQIYLGFTHLF